MDWKTVRKYVDKSDFNEPAPKPASKQQFCPKLDPYKSAIDKWLHEYSVSPKYANVTVNLKLTSSLVIVMDENYRETVRHRRLYGETKQQSMDWLPYLK